MKRISVLIVIFIGIVSLQAQGWGGGGWGSEEEKPKDKKKTTVEDKTTAKGDKKKAAGTGTTETTGSETGSTETKPSTPIIGTHYDDAPTAKYEPTATVNDGRPSMEGAVVVQYPYLREADAKFKRRIWRNIDVRQKLNKSFTWPRNPFTKNIYELATQGKIKAYKNDSFSSYYTPEEAWTQGGYTDVIEVPDSLYPDDPSLNTFKEFTFQFKWEEIKTLQIVEDWIFDNKHSEMKPRIIGIAPMYVKSAGAIKLDLPLFWLNMNELRPYLVKSEVYNRYNDVARISWDDLFNHYRLFDSYIVKTTDWDDLYINQKEEFRQDPLAALLMSEEIKNQLFMFEHDLWEY